MGIEELQVIIENGEDCSHQFKSDVKHPQHIAQEMVAYSNSEGGKIIIGVTDFGDLAGLTSKNIREINQHISKAASQHVKPPIIVHTQNFTLSDGKVVLVTIDEGSDKPY